MSNFQKFNIIWITVLFLFTHGSLFFSRALSNIGMIELNNWRTSSIITSFPNRAERLLIKATNASSSNRSAWRAVGFLYATVDQEQKAIAAWSQAETISRELLLWGKQAEQQMRYPEALLWYRRATTLSPALGDPWFAIGRLYQKQRNWRAALTAYQMAVRKNTFYRDIKSDAYFQQGIIYQWAPEHKNTVLALEMYRTALEINRFSTTTVKADAFYRRGEIYDWLGYDPAHSLTDYRQALTLYPDHLPARFRLGYNLYWQEKDLTQAEQNIRQAIEGWLRQGNTTNLAWAYRSLGDIYYDAGLLPKARSAYQAAAEIEPRNQHVQNRLEALNREE